MDDIYIYYVKMPPGQHEWVTPCSTGYTVYLDEYCLINEDLRIKEFRHAMSHIMGRHWEHFDINEIEGNAG